jgi:hypothetical protein
VFGFALVHDRSAVVSSLALWTGEFERSGLLALLIVVVVDVVVVVVVVVTVIVVVVVR